MTPLRDWLRTEQRVVVQGLTGTAARAQLPFVLAEGTKVVAGVAPGRSGTIDGTPIFGSVLQAKAETGCNVSLVLVPPQHVGGACKEAIAAEMQLVVVLTENVPILDVVALRSNRGRSLLIGPNSPGLALPGVTKLGFMPSILLRPGGVALLSRSGTLSYEVALSLRQHDQGISIWIGIGGDPMPLMDFSEAFRLVADDAETRALAIVGEIGGTAEENFAAMLPPAGWDRPVHALVVGQCGVDDEPLGHAGAIVRGDTGTYEAKVQTLRAAGVVVHHTPWSLAAAVAVDLR